MQNIRNSQKQQRMLSFFPSVVDLTIFSKNNQVFLSPEFSRNLKEQGYSGSGSKTGNQFSDFSLIGNIFSCLFFSFFFLFPQLKFFLQYNTITKELSLKNLIKKDLADFSLTPRSLYLMGISNHIKGMFLQLHIECPCNDLIFFHRMALM